MASSASHPVVRLQTQTYAAHLLDSVSDGVSGTDISALHAPENAREPGKRKIDDLHPSADGQLGRAPEQVGHF